MKIKKDMSIGEIVARWPETVEVFFRNGLHCVGCHIASFETLEDGARAHGIDLKKLLKELNEAVK
ncbi:MAG: disulfide oxidoreductase [Candidatus Aenigmatarchaeota archaeon]|nr:MAG: disulfide oxidoreductase [Candidatus Aenigmarchaeota archaeon]